MESPQRDPWPPTLPATIQAGPDATHSETDYHLLILLMDAIPISPRIAPSAPSYNLQTSPMPVGPYTEQGCAYGKALSGRTWHHIRPDYATQREGPYFTTEIWTASLYIRPITTHRAKIKKIAKCHILYTPNYPILPYLSSSFTLALTLHIDIRWKSAIYASSKHNVHNVTHKSVKQKVSKSNKVSHRDYRTDLLSMHHMPGYGPLSPVGWLSWRAMRPCVMPRRLVMARFAPPEWRVSRITQGASGARFAPWGRPSRTQKCDAYCHNFMLPRRSTRPAIVTEIYQSFLVFPFLFYFI